MKFTLENAVKNPCLKYNCSYCCNPVKINCLANVVIHLPFVEMKEIIIPLEYIETVRLKTYHCINFNLKTGLCKDYLNRPEICRNTQCLLFQTGTVQKQKIIVNKIKSEKFIRIPYKDYSN